MRFKFYDSDLADIPKLSVDGTVPNSIHFSHWEGNETPVEVKADTSTEIALNVVSSPNRARLTKDIELVTNNHFDTDGVLSVWTMLNGDRAVQLRDVLISAAEAGDFLEFTSETGVRASIVIQGPDQAGSSNETGSPLVRQLAGEDVAEARAYDLILPEVERVLTRIDDYEPLWRASWDQLAAGIESFESGVSQVSEYPDVRLSLITLSPRLFGPTGFDPSQHGVPFPAISRYAKGELFLIATQAPNGWYYRLDYPYYSWAETVVRPRVKRRDLSGLLKKLNEIEPNQAGRWQPDASEMTAALKFLDENRALAPSKISPTDAARMLAEHFAPLTTPAVGA